MTSLFIVNDSPYGTERGFNALRLATNLQPRQEEDGGAAHLPGRRFAVPSGQRVNYVDRRAAAGAPGQGRSDDVE